MPPQAAPTNNGLPSPSSPANIKDSIDREKAQKAQTSILEKWSLASLHEILPRDLNPPFWGKNLLVSLLTLAGQKPLDQAKTLLLDQIKRRLHDTSSLRRLPVNQSEFLTIGDVHAILESLTADKVSSDSEPVAELSIVVCGSVESSAEESSHVGTDGAVSSSEDEPLAQSQSRRASKGPSHSGSESRSDDDDRAAKPAKKKNNKPRLAHPLSNMSDLRPPPATASTAQPSTVSTSSSTAFRLPSETRPFSTIEHRPTPEPRPTPSSDTRSPARPRASPGNNHKPTAHTKPQAGVFPRSTPKKTGQALSGSSRSPQTASRTSISSIVNGTSPIAGRPSPASSRGAATAAKPSTASSTASTAPPNPASTAPSPSGPPVKTLTVTPNRPPPTTKPASVTQKASTITRTEPTSGFRPSPVPAVASSAETRRAPSPRRPPPPSQTSSRANAEPQQGESRSGASAQKQANSALKLLSQAAFSMSNQAAAAALGTSTPSSSSSSSQGRAESHPNPQYLSGSVSQSVSPPVVNMRSHSQSYFQPQSKAQPQSQPPPQSQPQPQPQTQSQPPQQPSPSPRPSSTAAQAPTATTTTTTTTTTASRSSKKRKHSAISQERAVRQAELDLEISSAVHKRAKFLADEAAKEFSDSQRELDAARSLHARLRAEAEALEARAAQLEAELRRLGASYRDVLGEAAPGPPPNGAVGGRGGGGVGKGDPVDVLRDMASCFEFLLQSIRSKPDKARAERDEAERVLHGLEAEVRLVQADMKLATAEEVNKMAELKQQAETLEKLRAVTGRE